MATDNSTNLSDSPKKKLFWACFMALVLQLLQRESVLSVPRMIDEAPVWAMMGALSRWSAA